MNTIFIRIVAVATFNLSLAGVQLLNEGGFYLFQSDTSWYRDIMTEKQRQNQAEDVLSCLCLKIKIVHVYDRGHTHLIVFVHACGYDSRAATISFAEL